jgi:AcrR family transcriptional regulator
MTARLAADARRSEIILCTRPLFAEKGSEGVTSRELARAAGISEGLLFKYFKSKERLHAAILESCRPAASIPPGEPSSDALVVFLREHFDWMIKNAANPEHESFGRLLLRSMAGDGRFARTFFADVFGPQVAWVERCLRVAEKRAELEPFGHPLSVRAWLSYLMQVQVLTTIQPKPRLVDYGASDAALAESALLFMLRGLGLKESAIRRGLKIKPERGER